MRLSKKVFGRS